MAAFRDRDCLFCRRDGGRYFDRRVGRIQKPSIHHIAFLRVMRFIRSEWLGLAPNFLLDLFGNFSFRTNPLKTAKCGVLCKT
jgi:hypothetical protein